MNKNEKTFCQIIRFRGKIEAFLVSIDDFCSSTAYTRGPNMSILNIEAEFRVAIFLELTNHFLRTICNEAAAAAPSFSCNFILHKSGGF